MITHMGQCDWLCLTLYIFRSILFVPVGVDGIDKGLTQPQPRQAAGFDDIDKGLAQPQPRQAAGFDDLVTTRNVTLFSCSAGEIAP